MDRKSWEGHKSLYGFDGAFPFRTYADYVWDSQFELECPYCGNDLLCNDYDGRSEPPWAEFWSKRFCDECGARIVVPEDSPDYSERSYGDCNDIASCADIEGWSLFYDEGKKRFYLVRDEHCQEALMSGWDLLCIEDIPKKDGE